MRKPLSVMMVFGTRPEAIKMAPVVNALRQRPEIQLTVAVTGQHRQMLDQVFADFAITPDIDLNLMSANQTLEEITARVLTEMSKVFRERKPDVTLVHGDTTTAMATALAAFYCRVRIGHVEAGLRSGDLEHPWPEELNRVYIDAIADVMFAPTETAAENIAREYARFGETVVTGNTGIDAVLYMAERLRSDTRLGNELASRYAFLDEGRPLVLVTGHRRESFGDGFQRICDGLASIASRGDCQILYPVHLNPNVRTVVGERLKGDPAIHLIDPVGYADMVYLMTRARVLLTDSGGIQEEGPALGKPVLVMRDVTERPEAVETGVVKLVGTDPSAMRAEVDRLLDDESEYARRARAVFPYGDGSAAHRIADFLVNWKLL